MSKAYTLIEIIIVITVLAILTGLASLSIISSAKSEDSATSKTIISSAMKESQVNSISVIDNKAWGVHLEEGRVIIFPGDVYNPAEPLNQTRILSNNTTASWILSGGNDDILFSKRTGKTANFGTITITGSAPPEEEIIVNEEGMIE